MLRYATVPVTPFAQNCSIVWCDHTMQAAVIDPGGELPRLREAARRMLPLHGRPGCDYVLIARGGNVGILPRGQVKDDRPAERIAQPMDLGRAPAARAADGLILLPPFPPEAQR